MPRVLGPILLVLICACAVVAILKLTHPGPNITPDSVTYLYAAQSLVHSEGLTIPYGTSRPQPVERFPPGFPLALAGISLFGGNPVRSAAVMNAMLFFAAVLVVALAVRMWTGSWFVALGCALWLTINVDMLQIYASVWSEPLFLQLLLLGFWALSLALQRGALGFVVVAALLFGGAIAVRYAGLGFLPAGLLLALTGPGSRNARLFRFALFEMVAALPMAILMLHNAHASESVIGRAFRFHPIKWHVITDGVALVVRWFIPDVPHYAALLLAMVVVLAVMFRIGSLSPIQKILSAAIVSYGLFLVVSISFFDAAIRLDKRILSPVLMLTLLLAASFSPRLHPKWAAVALTGILLFLNARHTATFLSSGSDDWKGYNSSRWTAIGPTLRSVLNAIPETTTIYSNAPDFLYYAAARHSLWTPRKNDPRTLQADPPGIRPVGAYVAIVFHETELSRPYLLNCPAIQQEWQPPVVTHLEGISLIWAPPESTQGGSSGFHLPSGTTVALPGAEFSGGTAAAGCS